jgi:hypothetical protein
VCRFLFLCTGKRRDNSLTINLNLSLAVQLPHGLETAFAETTAPLLSCPMKFNLRSLADAGKRAPSPRTQWCSYCKRNEHHLCSGTRRVNHGRTVPCECPHRGRHDPNRRLALNQPPPISSRTNTAVGRRCYLVADQAHPELSKEEVGILDLLARGLSREFPNPQRVGCPSSKVLRDIAFRKLRLAEVHEWLDHLGTCSPCYREFTKLRERRHEVANGRFLVVAGQ